MRFLIVLLASLLLLPPEPAEAQDRSSLGFGLVQVGLGTVFYRMDVGTAAVDESDPEMTGSLETSGNALGMQLAGPKPAFIPGLVPWVLPAEVSWRLSRRSILRPAVRYRTPPATFHASGSSSETRLSYTTARTEAVYALSDITAVTNGRQEPHDPFTFTVYGGAGSYRGWNYAGASAEWFPAQQNQVSVFGTAGVGTIIIGGGVAYYTNRYGHGLIASVTGGLMGVHANLGGQLELGEVGYLIGGIGCGSYFLSHTGCLPFVGFEYRFE